LALEGLALEGLALERFDLEGFDLPGALRRVAGNSALYRQLLQSLVHTQADAAERLQAALQSENLKEAAQILHALKGISANLGATALADATTELEAALQQPQCHPDIKENFETQLQLTMALIRNAFAMEEVVNTPQPDKRPAPSALNREQQQLLAQFDSMLGAFDGEALQLLNQQREALITALGSVGYDHVAAELMRFDFAAARAALHHHTRSMLQA
jgi:two-component system sensor histidine kinase/response regulator